MQTQGINFSATEGISLTDGPKKVSNHKKDSSNDFAQIMENRSHSSDNMREDKVESGTYTKLTDDSNRIKLSANNQDTDLSDVKDTDELEADIMEVLQTSFGLSEQDLLDIMQQMGIAPMDLLGGIDSLTGQYQFIDMDQLKDFVMNVYGVDDESAILTSDILNGQLESLTESLTQVIGEELSLDMNNETQVQEWLQDHMVVNDDVVSTANRDNQTFTDEMVEVIVDEPTQMVSDVSKGTMNMQSGQDNSNANNSTTTETIVTDTTVPETSEESTPVNMAELFVQHLNDAVKEVTTQVIQGVDGRNIVDQIVNHIRIRIIPQSTSMELVLNPEHLGRVNVNVSTSEGVTQATLTVQNQVAKEAIESQIVTLRETFEEKGLKVESIEVNVSEFGFKKDDDTSGQKQPKQTSKGNRSRRLSLSFDESTEEIVEKEKSQGDNVIDYTA